MPKFMVAKLVAIYIYILGGYWSGFFQKQEPKQSKTYAAVL